MYIMFFFGYLIGASLIVAIFTSVFVKNRKKGYLFLIIYLLYSIYTLNEVYKFSVIIGSIGVVVYIGLGIVTYFVIKKRLAKQTEVETRR